MLREFLKHHADRALRGVAYNAITNCHAVGLHSIMLHDEPENRIRMFVTERSHTLHTNDGMDDKMTLAVHPHHCDVRFVGITGDVKNHRYVAFDDPTGRWLEMDYKSAITSGGPGALVPTGRRGRLVRTTTEVLLTNPSMLANEMHTIEVPIWQCAAWLVIEGKEDTSYQSKCWTRNAKPDLTKLYQPMAPADIAANLQWAYRNAAK